MLYQPFGRNSRPPQRHRYTKEYHRIVPSPSNASPTIWVTNVGPATAMPHTDSQNHCAQDGRDTIDICCAPWPRHRDGLNMSNAGLHPHREAMHEQHTGSGPSCCVPFSDPHVHKVTRSNETRQGCNHINANTLGTIPPSREDTPDRRQVQIKKKKGYINKGFCAKTDLCPLASPRVALVGVRLLRHPDNGNTR